MNKTWVIVIGVLTAVLVILLFNQVRLAQRVDKAMAGMANQPEAQANTVAPAADSNIQNLQSQLAMIDQKLAELNGRLNALENRSQPGFQPGMQPGMQPMPPRSTFRPRPIMPQADFVPPRASNPTARPWSPEQVIGPPDTMQAGDVSTAWASRSPDGGAEWLKVDYDKEVTIAQVRVRETYNPGAVTRIVAVLADGSETEIWKGEEAPAEAPVDRSFEALKPNVRAKSVKIYLDTQKVPGWNEIDAVELIGSDGSRQWASGASASSTYADLSYPLAR